jgi:signal transduction histidine kinase/CheY-like chemotaxis protein
MAYGVGSQTGFTILEGGPVISDDLEEEKRFEVLPIVREHGLRSSMSVPMFSEGGEIIGAMLVHTKQPHRFTDAEVNLLSLVANQTAIAVQRAQLFEDLKQTKGLVGARTALAWMNMASGMWWHGVNTKALTIKEQLQALNHELRRHPPGSISPQTLAEVERRSDEMREVADAIRSKVITPPLSGEDVDSALIDELVRERVKQLRMKESYKSFDMKTTGGSGALVRLNAFWFNQALDQLIDNALKAMEDSDDKRLSIDVRLKNAFVEIAVTDTGKGFPARVLLTLFNKRVEKEPGSKGLGMGLLMVQCIVEAYRGELKVESTGPTGTTMVIRLPFESGERDTPAAADDFVLVGDSNDPHWRDILKETLPPSVRLEVVGEHEAAGRLSERKCRAVIVDAGAVDNFALLTSQLRTRHPDARIIVVTASPSWEFAREAFRSGATDYLRKSVAREELSLHLRQALTKPLSPWPYYRRHFPGEACHANTNAGR